MEKHHINEKFYLLEATLIHVDVNAAMYHQRYALIDSAVPQMHKFRQRLELLLCILLKIVRLVKY
jgi:hypothetical protein